MERSELYRCPRCGLQLEVTVVGNENVPAPLCCGTAMNKQQMNSSDGAVEKHVPVVEVCQDGILVKVGSAAHPMSADHFIEWIEVINGSYSNRYFLKPGDQPQAAFYVALSPKLIIRASCNKHGIWQKS